MSNSVIEIEPTPLMEAVEGNLLGHVSFVQQRLQGMTVDRRDRRVPRYSYTPWLSRLPSSF